MLIIRQFSECIEEQKVKQLIEHILNIAETGAHYLSTVKEYIK